MQGERQEKEHCGSEGAHSAASLPHEQTIGGGDVRGRETQAVGGAEEGRIGEMCDESFLSVHTHNGVGVSGTFNLLVQLPVICVQ